MDITTSRTKNMIIDYWDFREKIAGELLKSCKPPSIDHMFDIATMRYGVAPDVASEHVERFMSDIGRSLKQA